MPKCKKCSKSFPNRVKINGRIKNVCKRKYCLECSPFGKHNTKALTTKYRICKDCGKSYIYERTKGHTLSVCNSCVVNRRRYKLKEKAIQYKGGRCEKCGYNKCMRAMCFHHTNENDKDFGISGNHTKKWEVIKKELDKCVLFCSNCHNEVHEENEKTPSRS